MNFNFIASALLMVSIASVIQAQSSIFDVYEQSHHVQMQHSPLMNKDLESQSKLAGLPFINGTDFDQPGTTGPGFKDNTDDKSFSQGKDFDQPVNETPSPKEPDMKALQNNNPAIQGQDFNQPEVNTSTAETLDIEQPSPPPQTPTTHMLDRNRQVREPVVEKW